MGITAQKMMISPIKKLQDNLDCLPGKIVGGLGSVVRGLLEDALSNVVNNGDCVTEQFAGSLLNNINDQISSSLKAPLGGVSKILSAGTSVKSILGGSSNSFKSPGNLLDCNQSDSNCVGQGGGKKWTVGMGPGMQFDMSQVYDNVTKNANQDSIKPAGSSAFSNPDCAKPSFCAPPSVNIFGGGGIDASGRAILGDFVDDVPESADTARTASIIGVELDNPGLGYFDAPPIVTFQDPCGSGYGAIARADEIKWIHGNNDCFNATTREALQANYTFVILRNPFKRLLSFFLDKLCHPQKPELSDRSCEYAQKIFSFNTVIF